MEIKNIEILDSPLSKDRVRLQAEVVYDDTPGKSELYWYEADKKYAQDLSTSGNCWFTLLMPLAVTLGEPLRMKAPVDRARYANAYELMHIWKQWHPKKHIIPMEVNTVTPDAGAEKIDRVAAFFSGGIDAYFTVLRHEESNPYAPGLKVKDLLCVCGFDVSLSNTKAFMKMEEGYRRAADQLHKEFISIYANIRENRLDSAKFGPFYFGSAFASIAHMFEKRYKKVLLSSGGESTESFSTPWGSSPLIDHLLSSDKVDLIHDGTGFNRIDRTKFVIQNEFVKKTLRTCYMLQSDENCCDCEKCYRTMLTLYLLNELNGCQTYDKTKLDFKKVSNMYIETSIQAIYMRQILALAKEKNDRGIIKAINKSFRYSRYVNGWRPLIKRLQRKKAIWRVGNFMQMILLKNTFAHTSFDQ